MEQEDILKGAVEKWGKEFQIMMVFEEMAELQKELVKSLRGKSSKLMVAEEIADVLIMLDQLKFMYSCHSLVDNIRKVKMERLEVLLKK